MSGAELREKKEKLISIINELPEDKLDSVEAFVSGISSADSDTSIDSIYKNAVEQYHDTLLKLTQ